jgi:hypothetical protein
VNVQAAPPCCRWPSAYLAASTAPALSQGTPAHRHGQRPTSPQTTGQPDQGFEGSDSRGYTIYDALVNWDLSKADALADIKPGLATRMGAGRGRQQALDLQAARGREVSMTAPNSMPTS